MQDYEITDTYVKIGLVARVVLQLPLKELSQEISRANSLGPFIDPTAWRDGVDNMMQWDSLIKPLLEFQDLAREVFKDAIAAEEAMDAGE